MNLLVNGERREVEALTIPDLVKQLDLAPETILIEHNGAALLRSEWEKTPLSDNDRLEVLRVAAGG
jgi:thiamine biosynthesis protein ThiS